MKPHTWDPERYLVYADERGPAGPVEMVAEPAHPAEHLHRAQVEVGALPLPGLDESVDFITHDRQCTRRDS